MRGIRLPQKHDVEFNVLACVGRDTAYKPLDVYRFFKDAGVTFIQFMRNGTLKAEFEEDQG
jgi:uncharacterized protein